MGKWDSEKANLEKLIFEKNLSYEEIGRQYQCSSGNIRKVARNLGIKLPNRRRINPKETFNKGTGKKYYCLNCNKLLSSQRNGTKKFCSNACQRKYEFNQWIAKYKEDNSIAKNDKWGGMPKVLRRYIFQKFDNKCCQCGWGQMNPYTKTIPLEVDHIDGNSENNSESNLRLLCPNCHSLTSTYRGANRGHGRNITWIKTDKK